MSSVRRFKCVAKIALFVTGWFLVIKTQAKPFASQEELLFRPELYHGHGKSRQFFEGWYHKLVIHGENCNANENENTDRVCLNSNNNDNETTNPITMAVVPGVFLDHQGTNESHAFIFVTMNGEKQHYYRFDIETELDYYLLDSDDDHDKNHYIKIGNNTFSQNGMVLDLVPRQNTNVVDDASISIRGSVDYSDLSPWPIPSVWNLGAMGPVGYFLAPFLECYHDVLSMDHILEGKLVVTDEESGKGNQIILTHTNSRGYVEKDRGRSFPSLWIWMQTNSFPQHVGSSLFFSVARIPILGREESEGFSLVDFVRQRFLQELEFPGFTAAVWLHDTKRLIPFATWSGAYFEDLKVTEEFVSVTMDSGGIGNWNTDETSSVLLRATRYIKAWVGSWFLDYDSRLLRYKLELQADRRVPHVMLYAPKTTKGTTATTSKMEPFVNEALQAKVVVRLVEYFLDGTENVLLEDVGEHAGLEVHQNVQYLVDHLCGKQGGILACL